MCGTLYIWSAGRTTSDQSLLPISLKNRMVGETASPCAKEYGASLRKLAGIEHYLASKTA